MADIPRIPVHLRGTLRGSDVDTDASVRLLDDVVSIQFDGREYAARVDRIDGVVWEPPVLVLHVGRDAVELTGHAALHSLGSEITAAALALPELTRTMHSLGSRRGLPGADHDRFFAGLLAARRAAEGFVEPESRSSAFDSRRLGQSLTTLFGELAAERYPESPPDRRALEAELLEHAERLYAALEALGDAAEAVRKSPGAFRLAQWRSWTWAAQRVFEEADRCWIAVLPALAASPLPVPRRRFWRRSIGLIAFLPAALQIGHRGALRSIVIAGLGIDLVDIARVDKLLDSKGERALRRLFTSDELQYALSRPLPAQHLAARLAAKEAAFKALAGNSLARGIGWREIEVVRGEHHPTLIFHGRAAERAEELGVTSTWVSLTHSATTAGAVVVLESARLANSVSGND